MVGSEYHHKTFWQVIPSFAEQCDWISVRFNGGGEEDEEEGTRKVLMVAICPCS